MSLERTAKGTAQTKVSGTTLTIDDVEINSNKTLVVMCGFDQSQGTPTCKWGGITLTKVVQRLDAVSGVGVAIFIKPQVWEGRIANVILSWPGSISARVALASETDDFAIEDLEKRNVQVATTTPNTLSSDITSHDNEAVWGCHASNGPTEDTIGTPDNGDIPVMILGQRVGTTGGALDITIQETYAELVALQTVRSRLTGVTSRDYVSVLMTVRSHTQLSQGITPYDVQLCEIKFNSLALDFEDAMWKFNEVLDRYEVYDDNDINTIIAHSNNDWV